ncbi:MAG: helix-turn-helix domain-containing protein [Eubacterium sp.]|nr:helix-turn-helix domain-containing protein [Eubacterium sp.]
MGILDKNESFNFDFEKDAYRIGRRIKKIRTERGMSQADLGTAVGLSADRIQKYENGARKPKNDLLFEIAGALEVSPWALLDPNTMTYYGAMYALFEIAENFDMKIEKTQEGHIPSMCITVDFKNQMYRYFEAWYELEQRTETELETATSEKEKDEIKQFYNSWKWNFPKALADKTAKNLQKERIKSKIEELQEAYEKLNDE